MLIIDDDENTLELLVSMIEYEGFKVIRAHGWKEGSDNLFFREAVRYPDLQPLDAES